MPSINEEQQQRFDQFLEPDCADPLFVSPINNPCEDTGFCGCEGCGWKPLWFLFKAAILETVLRLPFNGLKIRLLRRMGARIGRNVYISVGVWIDPNFLTLLTIEDNVMLGMESRLMLHEFRQKEFRAGRIVLCQGCLIGAFSILGPGIEIGEEATVSAGAVVGRNVSPGATVLGNPARAVS